MNDTHFQIILGVIRAALISAGGALVAGGYLTDAGLDALVGAVVIIIGAAWGIWQKYQQAHQVTAAVNAGIRFSNADPNQTPPVDAATAQVLTKGGATTT